MPPFVSSQFSSQFLRQLQSFRHEHFLCDCRLVVAVGGPANPSDVVEATDFVASSDVATLEFPAHRLILAASSPFFKNLFTLKRQETVTTVNLNNCSPECLEVILQFLYSGELELGNCNPQQVLSVARVCQIKALEQILSTFAMQNGSETANSQTEKVETPTTKTTGSKKSYATGAIKRKLAENAERKKTASPSVGAANFFQKFCNRHSLFGCSCSSPAGSKGQTENQDENVSEASSVAYEPPPKLKTESESARPAASPSFSSFIADHENSNKNSIFPVPAMKFASPSPPPPVSNIGNSATPTTPPESPGHSNKVAAELPLSQKAAFAEPNNPRPGYYGPLLPTTSNQLSTAAALASAYLAQSASAAAGLSPANFAPGNIFPALFARPPHVPMFPSGFPPAPPPAGGESKQIRGQGVNTMMPSPSAAQVPQVPNAISPTEEAAIMTVPSSEKEGWCRNKKYIQKVPSGYQCTVCQKTYGRYNSVSYHVTIYHRNPPIRCDEPQCQFTTREARYIHFHKYYRHGTPLPKSIDLNSRSCPFCRHVAKSPAMLEKHVNRHMPDCIKVGKHYKCNQCGVDVPNQQEMVKHMWTHTEQEKKLLRCDQCSYKGKSESSLNQHKLFKHSSDMFQRKYICVQCGYSGPTQTNLDAHKALFHKIDMDANGVSIFDIDQTSPGSDEEFHLEIEGESPASIRTGGFRFSEFSENGSLDLSQDSPPKTPPPSCATSAEDGSAKERGDNSLETDLDDSHSKLVSEVTTGYHSMVDYGTV